MAYSYKHKRLLQYLYWKRKWPIQKIAQKFDVDNSTIHYYLIKYKIKRRKPKSIKRNKPSKKLLEKYYYKDKLSAKEIAKKFGWSSHKTALMWLMKYGISRRTKSETSTKYPKKAFSGNLAEKAYLIGLRTGDFWAKQHRNLVLLQTTSPKREQAKLAQRAFGKYTTVRLYKKRNQSTFNIYALLDPSFNFLLEKPKRLPKWILNSNKAFFAFLAGYADCEASWNLTKRKKTGYCDVTFSLASSDLVILKQSHAKLKMLGFVAHLNLSREKGEQTNVGRYSNDLYRLVIYRQKDVKKLAEKLLPFSKHQDKINKMKSILKL